ncbi:GyrI-like domain-containing protein [Candidatus Poribacteria bacterium]|nr:GyrI-like domain-containing protein [Candidatus Poribacteria bacterium]
MDIRTETIATMRVVAMRHTGSFCGISRVWTERFGPWLASQKLGGPGRRYMTVFHDDPREVPEAQLRSDACVTVPADYQTSAEGVHAFDIAGGKFAVTVHRGPYNTLGETWENFTKELCAGGSRFRNGVPCFESYLNDPGTTKPEDLLTAIYVPVE